MAIYYDKLFALLSSKGLNMYTLRRDKVVGTETLEKMRKKVGFIDTRTINNLCKYLNCQPGDIMEYVKDETK